MGDTAGAHGKGRVADCHVQFNFVNIEDPKTSQPSRIPTTELDG